MPSLFDEILFFSLSRHGDLDGAAGALAQGLFKDRAIFDLMGQQNEAWRRSIRIKLRDKGIEDFFRREALVGAWKIGAIAPVLKGPEEKDLDAKLSGLLGDGEHIRLFDGLWIDPLGALNGGERRDPVPQPGGALEFHEVRGLRHFRRKTLADSPAFARQKIARLAHEVRIVRLARFPRCMAPNSA